MRHSIFHDPVELHDRITALTHAVAAQPGQVAELLPLLTELSEYLQLQTKNNYRLFFEQAKTPILLIDPSSGHIENANLAAETFYGYPRAQLLQLAISDINCLTQEQIKQEMAHALAERRSFFLFPHRLASGEIRQVEVHSGPIVIDDQHFLYSTIYDITERIQAEEQLRAKRQRLENIITGTRAGTWEWNIPAGTAVLNNRWAEMIGYTLAEIAPFDMYVWRRFVHPDDVAKADMLLAQHFAGELDYYECELRMRHKQEHWIWVLSRGQVLERDTQGHPLLMAGTHQDITTSKLAELQLRKSEARYRALHDSLPVGCILQDTQHQIIAVNEEACAIFGVNKSQLLGKKLSSLTWQRCDKNGKPLPLSEHPSQQCIRSGKAIRNFIMGIQFEHRIAWLSVNSQPLFRLDEPQPYAVISSFSDITEQKRNEEKLSLAASVFIEAKEAILITETDGSIVQVNKAFTDITGYSETEVLGKNPRILQSGYHDQQFYKSFWQQLLQEGHWSGEIWNRRKNGEIFAELQTISAVKNENNETHHYVCLASDISHQKQHEKQLEQQAYYDLLTGLPNRKLLTDKLVLAMQQCQQTDNLLAVAYIDLDGFKQINDTYGHAIGDQLLMAVAGQMKKTLRETDTVARIGGDEFVALLNVSKELSHSLHLVKRLLHVISKTILIDDLQLKVSASIGLTLYPQSENISAEHLLAQADQAMYQAKQAGKNRYHNYDSSLDVSPETDSSTLSRY